MGARTNLWVLDKALLWAVRHTRGEEMAYTAFQLLCWQILFRSPIIVGILHHTTEKTSHNCYYAIQIITIKETQAR